ncbi:MAG: di-heme oxidoredictase family protein [Polyangiaceae bacterium]
MTLGTAALLGTGACGSSGTGPSPSPTATTEEPTKAPPPSDVPIEGASAEELKIFTRGDMLFDLPMREADGLGPLFTEDHCSACHEGAIRGPGLVQKMAIVEADGFTPAVDQSALPNGHTVHPRTAAGATKPIAIPSDLPSLKVSTRMGPAVLGRGYMEAVDDAEILKQEQLQASRDDGIRGRVHHVVYASEPNTDTRFHTHKRGDTLIGRFGFKARVGTLDDFTADAFQGDMGITSPLRPSEFENPEKLMDDRKPGIDVDYDSINLRTNYVRLLAIPKRVATDGANLFATARCNVCHTPSLRTRSNYPIKALANIDAPIYSDLLLHDMGEKLADGIKDGDAGSREWRSAPLIGMRYQKNFMHDGRATTIRGAILSHEGPGSQANDSVSRFLALPAADQTKLEAFVGSL